MGISNVRIGTKLLVGFIALTLIIGLVGYLGVSNINKVNELSTDLYATNTKPLGEIGLIAEHFQRIRVNLRDLILDSDPEKLNQYVNTIRDLDQKITKDTEEFQKTIKSEEIRTEFATLSSALRDFEPIRDNIIKNAVAGKKDLAMIDLRGDGARIAKVIDSSITNLLDSKIKQAKEKSVQNDETAQQAKWLVLTLVGIGAALAVGFVFYLLRLIASARSLLTNINDSSQQLSASSEEISASTEQLAVAVNSQSEMANQLSNLMDQMNQAIEQVASTATQVSILSEKTSQNTSEGEKAVGNVMSSMTRIEENAAAFSENAKQIGEIVNVIEDIAGQTNLLALNAAIEAARAGDHGKGFAVVADEVRKLAERSAQSTKEISSLIQKIQSGMGQTLNAVTEGSETTRIAFDKFKEIATLVRDTNVQVSEIAASAEEQSSQSEEVLRSVQTVSATSQETSASVEETASSAASLANLAVNLQKAAQSFNF